MFLLFADDTQHFEERHFYDYLDLTTEEDGSDLAATLAITVRGSTRQKKSG